MPTLTRAANAHAIVATGWTTPSNAFSTTGDNVYATALNGSTTKNIEHSGDYGFANILAADIPDGATIDEVRIRCEADLTAAVTGGLFGVQGRISGVNSGTEATKTTTGEAEVVTILSGVTLTDLRNASTVIKARCRGAKGNSSSALTVRLDYVRLEVDYSTSSPQTLTGALFDKTPAFIAGAILPGGVSLAGTLLDKTPSFLAGSLSVEAANFYAIFRRTPSTDAPFDPDVDIPIATTTDPTYLDENLPAGVYDYQVFAWTGVWSSGSSVEQAVVAESILGVVFTKPPAFNTGVVLVAVTLDGVTLAKGPTFISGSVTAGLALNGTTFLAPPAFIPGQVTTTAQVSGITFEAPPTFITGVVQASNAVSGVLFSKPPSFIPGSIITATQLSGVTFTNPPSFPQGLLSAGGSFVLGVKFSAPPTFISGVVTTGAVTIAGNVFVKGPAFGVGVLTARNLVAGTTLTKSPTFFQGLVSTGGLFVLGTVFDKPPVFRVGVLSAGAVSVNGVTFVQSPTFIPGQLEARFGLSGVVFTNGPSFIAGVVVQGDAVLTGVVFLKPPTFIAGADISAIPRVDVTVVVGKLGIRWATGQMIPGWKVGKIAPSGWKTGSLHKT